MRDELKKRIITSFFLILLLTFMYIYPFVMIISLVVISVIIWIEFIALISKIYTRKKIKDKSLRFLFKGISLLYLSSLVYFIFVIELYYQNLKLYLLYSILVAIFTDLGGLIVGKSREDNCRSVFNHEKFLDEQ